MALYAALKRRSSTVVQACKVVQALMETPREGVMTARKK
jgi:hypothetical protein